MGKLCVGATHRGIWPLRGLLCTKVVAGGERTFDDAGISEVRTFRGPKAFVFFGVLMEVTVDAQSGATTVRVVGEVDLATAPQLSHTFDALDLGRVVVVDLSGVSFIDSSGLNTLVQLRAKVESRGAPASLRVVITRPATRRIFEVTGLDQVFALYDSSAEALAAS